MEIDVKHYQRMLLGSGASGIAFGLGIGIIAGIFFAKKNLQTKYDALLEQEIADAKRFYGRLHKKDEFATPESAAETLLEDNAIKAITVYRGEESENDDGMRATENDVAGDRNIFVDPRPSIEKIDFNYEEEILNRSSLTPYIISKEEFLQAETDFPQSTLTYYAGDDILSDEKDGTIDDAEFVVGTSNLQRFGHGSDDGNVVYIRNENLKMDFEIIHSEGKYAVEVQGHIEHSGNSGLRHRNRHKNRSD